MRKLQFCKHWTSRTTKNVGTNQAELLVARHKRRYQEISSRMYQMPTE